MKSADGRSGLLLALRHYRHANLQLLLLLRGRIDLRLLLLQSLLEAGVACDLVVQGGLHRLDLIGQLVDFSQPALKLGCDQKLSIERLLLIG